MFFLTCFILWRKERKGLMERLTWNVYKDVIRFWTAALDREPRPVEWRDDWPTSEALETCLDGLNESKPWLDDSKAWLVGSWTILLDFVHYWDRYNLTRKLYKVRRSKGTADHMMPLCAWLFSHMFCYVEEKSGADRPDPGLSTKRTHKGQIDSPSIPPPTKKNPHPRVLSA